jgi:hypothetical protein
VLIYEAFIIKLNYSKDYEGGGLGTKELTFYFQWFCHDERTKGNMIQVFLVLCNSFTPFSLATEYFAPERAFHHDINHSKYEI